MPSKILSSSTNDFHKCTFIFQKTYFQLHLHKHIFKKMLFKNVYFDFFHLVFFLHSKEKITFVYAGLLIQYNLNMFLSPGLFEQIAVFDTKKKKKKKNYTSANIVIVNHIFLNFCWWLSYS